MRPAFNHKLEPSYERGRADARKGCRLEDNPYKRNIPRHNWACGYFDEKGIKGRPEDYD